MPTLGGSKIRIVPRELTDYAVEAEIWFHLMKYPGTTRNGLAAELWLYRDQVHRVLLSMILLGRLSFTGDEGFELDE